MAFWNWLKGLFGSLESPPHDYVESSLAFPELDVNRIRRRLQLAERGTARGANDEPPTTLEALDEVESGIVTTIEHHARLGHAKLVNHANAYYERLGALNVGITVGQLMSAADAARGDLSARLREGKDALFQLRSELVATTKELDAFQSENGLQRLPRYPHSRVLHWGIMMVLVLVEAVLNGSLLAKGDPLGLVGGVMQALVIALLNVTSGFIAGRVVAPSVLHVRAWRRVLGVVGTVALLLLALVFNLGVAHYRAALGGDDPGNAERAALESLLANPLAIPDLGGWLLFMLGLGFAFIAAVDSLMMDDPYPGYGKLGRMKQAAIEDYRLQKAELSRELEEVRNEAAARLYSLGAEVDVRERQQRTLLQSIAKLEEMFERYLSHLQQCANDLLATYREANRKERHSQQPVHFAEHWRLMKEQYQLPESLRGKPLSPVQADTVQHLHAVRQQIEVAYQAAVLDYKSIDELIEERSASGGLRPRQA